MYVVLFHTLSEVVSIIANVNLYVVYAYICTIQVDATTSPPNYQGRISKLRGYVHKVSNTNYLFFSILGGRGEKPHQTSLGMNKTTSPIASNKEQVCVALGLPVARNRDSCSSYAGFRPWLPRPGNAKTRVDLRAT